MYEAQPGDILKVQKGPFKHYGIYVGNEVVFQNNPTKGEHESSFEEFANGKPVSCYSLPYLNRQEIMERLSDELKNAKKYSLFFNNCEHTITKIVTGRSFSPQLQAVMVITVAAFLAIVFFSKRGA